MVAAVPREPVAPVIPEPRDEAEGRRIDMWWCAAVLGLIALLFASLRLMPGVAVPVFVALSLAYALNPMVTLLANRGLNRVLGTTLVFFAGIVAITGAMLYLVPVVRDEALKFPGFLESASTQLVPRIEILFGVNLPDFVRERATEVGANLSTVFQDVGPAVAKVLASLAGNTARWVGALLGLAVIPVLQFFFLIDFPQMVRGTAELIPRKALALVTRRFREVDGVLSAFVRGQLIVGSILSAIYTLGLSLARVELAIVIGLIAGFGNMVPYLGTGLGVVLALLAMIFSWQGPWQLLVVAGTFIIGQMLEGFVITPRIVGDRVGLSSVVVIIAILAFSELFGFVGILLAVPVSAVLKVVIAVAVERYRHTQLYRGT